METLNLKGDHLPRVSVVMATFNGARFISDQLQSLVAQSRPPYEIIIADDGSTDGTADIVKKFADAALFPVRFIQNDTRLGYGENFLNATRFAGGDFIAFCDQDDIWRQDKLEIALDALAVTNSDLYIHGARLMDDAGKVGTSFLQGIRKKEVCEPLQRAPWGVFYGFSMVFRREILFRMDSSVRGAHTFEHSGMLSHDLWVYFLGTSLYRTVLDPEPLVDYRQHAANVTPHLTGAWFRRWTSSLGKAVDPKLPRDAIAYHRAEALRVLGCSTTDEELRRAVFRAAHYWRLVGDVESRRAGIYQGSFVSRGKSWLVLAASGGYGSHPRAGLGHRLAVKDAIAGVAGIRRAG